MGVKQFTLLPFLMLAALSLEAYWIWYSYHFAEVCSASLNSVPAPVFLFTGPSLLATAATLTFGRNPIYILICLAIWLLHIALQVYLINDELLPGYINCYRDIGGGMVVSFVLNLVFCAAIIAVTLASGVIWLVRKWLYGPALREVS